MFVNHVLKYIAQNTQDEALSLETYVEFCYFGQSLEDLTDEEQAAAAREFEEALESLRGED